MVLPRHCSCSPLFVHPFHRFPYRFEKVPLSRYQNVHKSLADQDLREIFRLSPDRLFSGCFRLQSHDNPTPDLYRTCQEGYLRQPLAGVQMKSALIVSGGVVRRLEKTTGGTAIRRSHESPMSDKEEEQTYRPDRPPGHRVRRPPQAPIRKTRSPALPSPTARLPATRTPPGRRPRRVASCVTA